MKQFKGVGRNVILVLSLSNDSLTTQRTLRITTENAFLASLTMN